MGELAPKATERVMLFLAETKAHTSRGYRDLAFLRHFSRNRLHPLRIVDVCLIACFCYSQKASLGRQHLLLPIKQALWEPFWRRATSPKVGGSNSEDGKCNNKKKRANDQ